MLQYMLERAIKEFQGFDICFVDMRPFNLQPDFSRVPPRPDFSRVLSEIF